MRFNRVAVVGISACGKTTFAQKLAARTGLPLFYGDQLEWHTNWRTRAATEIEVLHRSWLDQPRWIIEGWIDVDRIERLTIADVVVDLDYASPLCAWRALQRMIRGVRRSEMPDGCVDKFSWRVLRVVFWKLERPAIESALSASSMKKYVRLTSSRESEAWLNSL